MPREKRVLSEGKRTFLLLLLGSGAHQESEHFSRMLERRASSARPRAARYYTHTSFRDPNSGVARGGGGGEARGGEEGKREEGMATGRRGSDHGDVNHVATRTNAQGGVRSAAGAETCAGRQIIPKLSSEKKNEEEEERGEVGLGHN